MRQGPMGSDLRARVIELQMDIEESGAVGMYIPEEARIRGIRTTYNITERSGNCGTMTYLQMVEGGGNEFESGSLGLLVEGGE